MTPASKLQLVKVIHTVVWAVFAGSIVAIPIFAHRGHTRTSWWLIGFVAIEVIVLLANRMRCPLTDMASHYTSERQDNFDIYLPLWLARHNQRIFGGLYVAGIVDTLWWTFRAAP